ncbi:MAG: SurA N-terminal domain-containing protein [Proteobacteria bacterium]|nr:SurA N-terminal domain-containing protein [Pseudomonadota bacterium]MBU1419495.1 SurA N-terminal domain-containing protein [Pseudomonadota bacterium]MBU1456032.1 SurA N-terminal domain-containing protein [Pseudomonadota bacterium]
MKYLFTIFVLVALSSAVTLYYLWPSDPVSSQDVALRVNGHPMSRKQIDDQSREQGYHGETLEEQMDSLVTRQLLLQEAQRLGIDKEEGFRKALKLYYEQSLIKVLTDRKMATLTIDVSEEDIDRYLSCSGKRYTFTQTPIERGNLPEAQSRQNTVLFDDLSEPMRFLLSSLQPGESASQFDTGTEVSTIRLDKVEEATGQKPVAYDRSRVRELIGNSQRSREIDSWIHSLRKNASIVIYGEVRNND